MEVQGRKKSNLWFWFNWKISSKIVSIVICILAIAIVAMIAANYFSISNELIKDAGQSQQNLGAQALQQSVDRVTAGAQMLKNLAMMPSIIEAVQASNVARQDWTGDQIKTYDQAWINKDPSSASLEASISANPITAILTAFVQANPDEVEVFLTDIKGLNVGMTDRTSDFLQGDEGWWASAFNNGAGSVFVDKVEYDDSSKSYAMNIGVPVYDPQSQKAIGVLRGTLDISVVIGLLSDIKVGSTGHAVLVDAAGEVLYSPESGWVMKAAPDWVVAQVKGGQNGWLISKDLLGVPVVTAYNVMVGDSHINLGWSLFIERNVSEVNQTVGHTLLASLATAGGAGLLGLLLSLIAVTFISKPVVALTHSLEALATGESAAEGQDRGYLERTSRQGDEVGAMLRANFKLLEYFDDIAVVVQKVSEGDLTAEFKSRSGNDRLGTALTQMILNLRRQVEQVSENASKLKEASELMSEAARQAGHATQQIATTMQQLTRGATQQSSEVTLTVGSVEQMSQMITRVSNGTQEQATAVDRASSVTAQISASIQQVAGNAQAVTQDSNQAANAARAGYQTVVSTVKGMQEIRSKVGLSANKVQEMGSRSDQIGAIVETIEDIASQTNLLALNAAIEAARAGEHGKGFAVVADEVRKLAERAATATKEIGSLIHGIQQTVHEAVAAMNDSAREVETGVDNANKAGEALKAILEASESVNKQAVLAAQSTGEMNSASQNLVGVVDSVSQIVNQTVAIAEKMSANSTEVTRAIESIASVSEQNSAAFEEVAASAQEMTAQVDLVAQSADSLAGMAQDLEEVVAQFVLA